MGRGNFEGIQELKNGRTDSQQAEKKYSLFADPKEISAAHDPNVQPPPFRVFPVDLLSGRRTEAVLTC
jgi:hypothetical protein